MVFVRELVPELLTKNLIKMERNTIKGLIVIMFLIVICIFGYKGYLVTTMTKDGKHLYEITIPGNKRQETSFYTNSYVEKDGCVNSRMSCV